ncbi:hypothetical protein LPJ61_003555 [Coemansia biformis]|uniref:RING-type domain-containing protein n=1 Tax=Coemansia biformis TaxID=1286918 RepID=A0A9W7YAB9_9FUNG|nr:hypothetical protein LPJ61_003555 [Coemansia biformis]
MDNAVVDLTDSPPLATGQAAAFNRPPGRSPDDPVLVSSDDEAARAEPQFAGVTPLPAGYVLPPIHRPRSHDHGRPERITTLRDILSTRGSRSRARSILGRQRDGYHLHPGAAPGSFLPHMVSHTGEEPVEPGVYYPIRARAMLPGQRQRQREQGDAHQQQQQQQAVSRVGRETADGAIDVEDVDEGSAADSDGSFIDDMGSDLDEIVEGEFMTASDDDDGAGLPMLPDGRAGQTVIDYLMLQQENRRMMAGELRAGGPAHGTRGRRRPTFAFPFHPDMVPAHMRPGHGHITSFDFFPGEDISALLTYLEATTPAPPARPMAPAPPLKLSKRQEELAAQACFSRAVPPANFRDSTDPAKPDELEIVCVQCTSTLFDKEPVWAPACGHIMCNACVDGFTGASKSCVACRKRIMKKALVHLYL